MAQVTLSKVCKSYDGKTEAVSDVNLEIADGEFLVLVGPSGCGKSTTLRMVAGLEEVTAGEIRIGERVVNYVHPKDRDIAMVFQNYALYPHMTVYKNMAFALKLRKTPKAEIDRRVREASAMLGLDGLLERKPAALSGGQRQRVALGRAIVREPKAFLFDEPLSNLDAKLRVTTRAELKALHRRLKTTTIYVTHDQEEAMTLGDRIVVMSNGRVQQVGAPLEVYRRPVNRFVAGFLGTPPMNFLEGVLKPEGGRLRFEEAGGGIGLTFDQSAAAGFAGGEAVAGIRPEALRPVQNGEAAGVVSLTVVVVEPLGDRSDVYLESASGRRLTARVSAEEAMGMNPGDRVGFSVDSGRAHLFEPGEFGRNLGFRTERANGVDL